MLPIGHVLGETYRVERLLTHGGMAAIYVVAHTRLRRRYALKIIAANLAEQGELIERFNREADILSELQHPHVVDVIDYNIYQERYPYLVMELLDGEDLAHFLRRQRRLDPAVALPIFLQISEALNAVHGAGIIHRDLKPGNVFLCSNGPFTNYTKVLDFGIAKVCNPQAGLQTQNSGLLGTPAYMAPEQVLGPADAVSAKTDQFSLAVILYEMLAGQPAFHRQGEPMLRTLNRVCYEEPEALSDCPLWPVLARALSKNPDDRYPTLQEFVLASGALDLTGSMLVIAQRTRPVRRPALVTGSQVAVSGAPPSLAAVSPSQGGSSSGASSAESPLSRVS
ncbi:MAG TPA: serine/threonine-protein kinase, partial [Pseudomonadota bacterium]|nr:serine/threonine-protein kinase [Pseudomonadota bacterium]